LILIGGNHVYSIVNSTSFNKSKCGVDGICPAIGTLAQRGLELDRTHPTLNPRDMSPTSS
jgi:hypothetical protein